MRRTLTTLLATTALLLGGLAAPVLLLRADASPAAVGTVAHGDKPARHLHDSIVTRHGNLYFKGRVDPGHGPVIVQKKQCLSTKCPWRFFKKVKTHGPQERWQARVYAPKHGNWFWRGYVKGYGGYARSWTHSYKTYTTRF
jgi:hypothetical protein